MNKHTKTLVISAILFAFGLFTTIQSNTPTALAQNNVINVCSHNGTQNYNILGSNAATLRQKLDNEANFGPNGAYGQYDFQYIDVGDNFTKQTILDNACNIWFSGYETDESYTPSELSELQSWVQETNGQVMAGCDATTHDPVCALLDFSVTTDTDSYGFLTDTVASNPLNCNGALGPNSQLEMAGGVGGYFSGPGVTTENTLAVHETNGAADSGKPIVIYTGKFFFTADINMIQSPTISNGPNVTNNNDILVMNAFSALADASIGKQICTSVEPAPTPTAPPPTPVPAPPQKCDSCGDVHINTPDGLVYDFQEMGEFILSQSTSGEVVLQVRQERWASYPERPVSVNTAVAMYVAGDKLEFYLKPERSFYVNDVLTDLPTGYVTLPAGGSIDLSGTGNSTDFTILWPDGNTGVRVILSKDYMDIGIARLGGSLTYEGILGNLDGNRMNDIQLRDGELITPPASLEQLKRFGDSWRLSAEESLFNDPLTAADTAEAAGPLTINDLDAVEKEAAADTCETAGVTDPLALHNCTYDVAVTGDESFVESAKTFQEDTADIPDETFVAAVPSQGLPVADPAPADTPAPSDGIALEIGQQYAVPDAPGTFRYFQLTAFPTEAESRATLSLCPDGASTGLVVVGDILTEEMALEQGLVATNEPCVQTTAAPAEPAVEATTPAETVETVAEEAETATGGLLSQCGLGFLPFFLLLGMGVVLNRRPRLLP